MVDGLVLNRGFASEEFLRSINDTQVELVYPLVLVVKDKLKTTKQMVDLLELVKPLNRPIAIFSEHLTQDPFSTLVYNLKKGDL